MAALFFMGVTDQFAFRVVNQDSAVGKGYRLLQGRLQPGPAIPRGIMLGQESLEPCGPDLPPAVLKTVNFPLGRVSHVEADAGQGQSQSDGES
jgi:hypothetical protein